MGVSAIEFFEHQLADLEQKIRNLRSRIDAAQSEVDQLKIERDRLKDYRAAAAEMNGANGSSARHGSTTALILSWLDAHPEGGRGKEIVEALEDEIQTKSPNPASIIYSTLGSLRDRGRVSMRRGRYVGPTTRENT